MLLLTDVLGTRVLAADGNDCGRLVELTVDAADPQGRIRQLGVSRHRHVEHWIDADALIGFGPDRIQLRDGARFLPGDASGIDDTELFVVRDVLDVQILDTDGQQVVRVGDVVLDAEGSGPRVTGTVCGGAAVARRLGLRRLATHFPERFIAWNQLHFASGRGLTAQLASDEPPVTTLPVAHRSVLLAHVPSSGLAGVIDALGPRRAAETIAGSHTDLQAHVVHALPHEVSARIVDEMTDEHAAAWLRSTTEEHREGVLGHLDTQRAAHLRGHVDALDPVKSADLHGDGRPGRRRFRHYLGRGRFRVLHRRSHESSP